MFVMIKMMMVNSINCTQVVITFSKGKERRKEMMLLPSILEPGFDLSLTQIESSGQFQSLRGGKVPLNFEPI